MVEELDPGGKNHALKQMVVVGHSQGGLLTKLTAVEAGDCIIEAVAEKDIDEIELTKAEKELIDRYLVYTPQLFIGLGSEVNQV